MPFLQKDALTIMTNAFHLMEASIQKPIKVPFKDSFVYRYINKSIHEALIQKLARVISGLNAIQVLINYGYTQETGVLFRTLDEMHEDISFLATSLTNNAHTDRHDKYLDAFYADAIFSRTKNSFEISKPNLVPRKKIRAHTINILGDGIDATKALNASESISTAYSGYVHAASENIMDMYGGNPERFHLTGMLDTPRMESFYIDAETYMYRSLIATAFVAKAFGDAAIVNAFNLFLEKYEKMNGHTH
jgi:hypothetical protein